jgi:bifunctional UDP-N-acetylglucosamine pyrophosphorylase/glucosamine-1-phosphate N-acetyltransferase
MAAGKGARMRSATPKVLHPIAGAPMVRHVVSAVRELRPAAILVVVSPSVGQQIAAAVGADVECVEQPDPLGTGHALSTALPRIGPGAKHILLLNADTPLLRSTTLQALIDKHIQSKAVLSLLAVPMGPEEAHDLGRLLRDGQGRTVAVVEASEASPETGRQPDSGHIEVNVGVYCIEVAWLQGAIGRLQQHAPGEIYVTDLVALAREAGKVVEAQTLASADEGLGVNSRGQLAQAETAMQRRLRSHWMAQGVTMEDPATTYLHVDVKLEADVVIRPNTRLQGQTRVGRDSEIGPDAQLTDVTVQESCRVGSSILAGVVMETDVSVGPYCHLRTGTYLERGVRIGSHVEIKNSRIGAGTHIGHFCYVGDATLGPNVNFGAGAITCNFDGIHKHATQIGEGASIGSDTMLVAPVKIGARAVTGAGAVITHDVPDGATVVGVPARPLDQHGRPVLERAIKEEG